MASLRDLPSVDKLLQAAPLQAWQAAYGRAGVLETARAVLDALRAELRHNGTHPLPVPALDELVARVGAALEARFRPSLRPVINATGVIIHTNLGRAPLSLAAQQAIVAIGGQYSTLEFDLEDGKRGSRYAHAEAALCELTGAEAALVVNNAAAALVLVLSALAQGRQVILSRGHLVEIGGAFRVPEIMAQSGALLVEVGTTNRTRIGDYAAAISPQTAMLMHVHSSNFRMIGFTEEAPLGEMAALAHERGLICVQDLGSGALLDTAQFGLSHEPTVQESVQAGVDLVVFSGDKLLGGPQGGIIVGRRELVAQLKKHPLARALRVDKLGYAALAATLDHYRCGQALAQVPVWRMLSRSLDELLQAARRWADAWGGIILPGQSTIGGGSLPGETLPTTLAALHVPKPDAFLARLRQHEPPIIARIQDERVLFDPRTVLDGQEDGLIEGVKLALERERA
ncbi:MAG: L-seryl-tRNA(Sec) selenium transferase [Anaerolineae bacterium]|nr:L-seryl-tRNA(Sec) selenium transferase [Anaerolineae bacterium]MDW8172227.1 L-seryl-tRNA(Sec) selenium transferase [Anaerolineae bacterium]